MDDPKGMVSGEANNLLNDLYVRRAVCLICIKTVSAVDISDPRREGAIAEYNWQLAEIDAKITKITDKPPDIVIGLKPAIITSKSP